MHLNQALKELFFYHGVIPKEAIKYLIVHRKEATPLLLVELKNGITHSKTTGNYYVGHLFHY